MGPMNQPRPRKSTTPSSSQLPSTEIKYCKTCGRHISPRANFDELVYCSAHCRSRKPSPLDRSIEGVFLEKLAQEAFVLCSAVEAEVFADRDGENQEDSDDDVREDTKEAHRNEVKAAEGMKRARNRERVKQAARRVVVFKEGYVCKSRDGVKLDVSHAHGDWGVSRA